MATTPSYVQVTEGAGKKLAASTYTENSQVVYDSKVVLGEHYLAAYTIIAGGVSSATANSHLLQIMAGASLNVRLRRILIKQAGNAAALGTGRLQVVRLTTAGTGGGAVTPSKLDNSDAASGCTGMTLPTVKGTEGSLIYSEIVVYRNAIPTGATDELDWDEHTLIKPLIIPAGTANGLAIKNGTADASATFDLYVEVVETSF